MKKYFAVGGTRSIGQPRAARRVKNNGEKRYGKWLIGEEVRTGLDDSNLLTVKQIHSGNIISAAEAAQAERAADGLVLGETGQRGAIKTADCAPLVIMTDETALILHVSRKSMVNGLLDNVMTYINPFEINHIYVGPHICEYHFSFDDEDYMVRRFRTRWPKAVHYHKGVLYLSLDKALQYFFEEWRVHQGRIDNDGRCTFEILSLPSYRRQLQQDTTGEEGSLYTILEKS